MSDSEKTALLGAENTPKKRNISFIPNILSTTTAFILTFISTPVRFIGGAVTASFFSIVNGIRNATGFAVASLSVGLALFSAAIGVTGKTFRVGAGLVAAVIAEVFNFGRKGAGLLVGTCALIFIALRQKLLMR